MVIKKHVQKIKETDEKDYRDLLFAAALYTDCVKKNEDDSLKEALLTVVTDILDKHGIHYINDIQGGN